MQSVTYTIARPDTGAVLPYAVVTVYQQDGTTRASLFDAEGAAIGNPLDADINGAISFAALNGTYILRAVSADGELTLPGLTVQVFDLAALATAIAAGGLAGVIGAKYATKAARDADLAKDDGTIALVYADSEPLNNDLSYKIGASGSGSWSDPLGLMAGLSANYAVSSRTWAEGPGEPGGPGTKSAKGWAEEAAASASEAQASSNSRAPYIPLQRADSFTNAVRNRFNSSTGAAALTAITGGNVTSPAVAIAYNDDLFNRTGQPACYRASGTASAAGTGPRFSIPITPADLALIGLVPDDTTPPHFSVRAAIQLDTLINQTIDASVGGTTFLNGFWYVTLRYAGAGASLDGPNDPSTDVVFVGSALTPASSLGIGSGDTLWSGSTGSQTVNADEKIMLRQNVPLRANYGGQALSGLVLVFFGSAAGAGATSFDVGRVAVVAGSTISETESYLNLPEDAVFAVARRNLPEDILLKVDSAATESPIAARITALNGSNPAAWALGMDQAWDFTTGLYYGGAVAPTDTHAAVIWLRSQAGYMTSVSANALARAEAVGLVVQPSRTELIVTPRDWSPWYTTTTGVGTTTQNRRDPAGTANKAYTLTDTDTGTTFFRQRNEIVANDTGAHTASVFIRKTKVAPAAYPSIFIGYVGGTPKNSRLVLDPLTGKTLVTNPANAAWSVSDVGEFWKVTGSIANNGTGNTTFFHQLTPAFASTFTTTGAATAQGSHVFAWASIQKDTFPATELPDGGNGGGNIVLSDQSAFTGSVAGLVTLDIRDPGATGVRLFSLDDGSTDNYLALEYVSGNAVLRLMAGGVEQAAVVLDQWRTGRQSVAFVAGTNYVWAQFLRGDSVSADTSATYPTLTKLGFGGNSTSTATRRANVVIEKVALRYGLADADTAMEMLERAEIAHGRIPAIWDNFDRADSASLGSAPTGHTWAQLPAGGGGVRVLSAISGKKIVTTDSGAGTTAAYNTVQLRETASHVRARISFAAGTTGGAAALILTKTLDTTSIVDWIVLDGAVHIVFSDTKVDVGLFLDNGSGTSDFFVLTSVNYPTPMALDGTIYEIGYDLDGNEITLFAPNTAPVKLTHPRFLNLAGPYVTWEPFWTTGQCQVRFHEVEAW